MGKIIYLMGKSSSGKDTIFKELIKEGTVDLQTIVPYTTRPIREGEQNGVEYFFTDEEGFQRLKEQGKVIEDRSYHTFHGLWRYFTVDDGQIQLDKKSYIIIGTLESYQSLKAYYGADNMLPVLIELDDGVRLQRALNREIKQQNPKYEEMCRRFLADSEDFADEKIREAGIGRSFYNDDLKKCLREILDYINENIN
ncbi:MAG: guanylate kinase [Lachnospiraceae bacterium]|nr:guanylate kinase [Lachnospiraceae bacterium]